MKKKIISLLLAGLFVLSNITVTYATEGEIADMQAQKQQAEAGLAQAQADISAMEGKKQELEDYLSDLNAQYEELTNVISDLSVQAGEKENQLKDIQKKLKKAQKASDKQYEDMKLRIQYMYENGGTTALQTLFSSKDLAEFLNTAESVSKISQYDRNMLPAYQELTEQIKKQKKELEEQKEDLTVLQQEKQKEQEKVNSLIEDTQKKIQESSEKIEDAQSDVESIDAKIEKMIEYEKQLEIQKAKEDAARLAAIKKQEQENRSNVTYAPAQSDAYLLAAIIQCEARGEPYDGKLAVGSVIMNRVRSSYFPNTVSGVIYQGGQFSPVASGRLAYRLEQGVASDCMSAAQAVLGGTSTTNCLYFRVNNGIIEGTVIGNHVFY